MHISAARRGFARLQQLTARLQEAALASDPKRIRRLTDGLWSHVRDLRADIEKRQAAVQPSRAA